MSSSRQSIDAMGLYRDWLALDKGTSAKLRRATTPEALLDIPAFYALVSPYGWPEQRYPLLRCVFCLTSGAITHCDDDSLTLGRALARSEKINLSRVTHLIRQDSPQDMVQLRRILIHAEPRLYWPSLAEQLTWWGKYDRRTLLEHFVLSYSANSIK
ncbi:type I-E CRISPR-associated protein Cse2/CasB [Erwinia sp. OLTSP20]|nr:type I-E CRISPR-associated protein Cse2/CasB [Erwinia sp. OAMSP11]PIJ70966.1 type I-E CRISPR-associated protein Cse2/CasB [Erwinia sp. OLSSP12]PIJ80333.1 type I-E CRISPR-associated protein Cse2/CasB [Erwinia sp. OLCASP19]PIJ82456.1 type I-E CRISPR-associated protein Cse2/CasB [Erwinia sp. OLMTSP26]PIJ85142.1 type I-E CRISPR-associated protein Cse2/CasB [Erwinia sp. OLMDSP33]PIJ92431.1 type I-E CRISPR-associated protein Cse2/CasB [Erwinia sp. OLTSP20]PIJ95220.1 type I-E CRISPR-associated pr